jgi:hypothetical protein
MSSLSILSLFPLLFYIVDCHVIASSQPLNLFYKLEMQYFTHCNVY